MKFRFFFNEYITLSHFWDAPTMLIADILVPSRLQTISKPHAGSIKIKVSHKSYYTTHIGRYSH